MNGAAEDGVAADRAVEDGGGRRRADGGTYHHRGRWNNVRDLGGHD